MTKAELLKKNRSQIEVLKDLLLDEKESRNKLELNYKYLSDAVNSEIGKNAEFKAEIKTLKQNNHYKKNLTIEIESLEDQLKDEKLLNTTNRQTITKLKHELKHKAIKIHQDKIPMEYKAEASEYFDHNPKSKGVRFHMIDFDEYGYDNNNGLNGLSGTYGGDLYAEDCIIEIDNL